MVYTMLPMFLTVLPMNVTTVRVALVALLLVSLSDALPEPGTLEPTPSVADYNRVRDGYIAAREGRCDDVMALLPTAVNDTTFPGFPEFVRRGALEHIIECAEKLRKWGTSIPYLYQLIEMSGDKTAHWLRKLVRAGVASKRPEISVDALQRLAAFGKKEFRRVWIKDLWRVHQQIKREDRGDDIRYAFLRTLHDNRYTPRRPFLTADDLMIDYARMSADRGDTGGLRDIVLALTQPGVILQVRIDRRFDAIRQDGSLESFLDLDGAAEREIARLRVLLDERTNRLRGYIQYAKALAAAWRFEEALEVIEPVALKIRMPDGKKEFVDAGSEENWVIQEYSNALRRVRYAEQAEDMYREAAETPENKHENVSQQINYASSLVSKGKFSEALAIVAELEEAPASEYGRMWIHKIVVCANAMAESPGDYSVSLTYLIEHERDNPAALIEAYLCMNNTPKAAAHLIRRLYSSDQRIEALLSLQYSKRSKNGDSDMKSNAHAHETNNNLSPGHILRHRFEALRDHRDVHEAIDQVGRIEEVWLDRSAWFRH